MKEKVKNNAPLIIGQYPNQQRLSRKFLGDIDGKSTIERKELKAYLKGQTHFFYGSDALGNPIRHEVRQEYFYTN